jgi:hypothetical protein
VSRGQRAGERDQRAEQSEQRTESRGQKEESYLLPLLVRHRTEYTHSFPEVGSCRRNDNFNVKEID